MPLWLLTKLAQRDGQRCPVLTSQATPAQAWHLGSPVPGVSWLLNVPAVHHPQPRTSGLVGKQNWITSFCTKPPMTPITSRRKLKLPLWPRRFSRLLPPILSLDVSDPLFCYLTFAFSPAVTLLLLLLLSRFSCVRLCATP